MSLRLALRPFAVCSAFCLFGTLAYAQNKVAVISLQNAVLGTADIKAKSAAMEARFKPRVTQLEGLDADVAKLTNNLQANQGKLTPQAEGDMTNQLQRKQRDAQRLRDDLQADLDNERNTILGKASQQMQDVVKKYAEANNIDVVVEAGSTIYFKGALDITKEVIAAYDKQYPASAPSGPAGK
jgi:outer membrane protein